MTTPKVSVLIPTYNYAQYLPEAIESVLAQNFADLELVISDDCSTDNSAEIISSYATKDSRIRFTIHQKNLGMVRNWNWCLSQARGEFVKFLFGDDKLISKSAISQMVGLMESDSSISLISTASLLIDANSKIVGARSHFKAGVFDGNKAIIKCLTNPPNCIGEPSLTMFRKSQADEGFDVKYRQIVDLEMWLRLLENGKFGYLEEPFCAFRKHDLQQTNVNRSRGDTEDEIAWLVEKYISKPWIENAARQKILFTQTRWLGKAETSRQSEGFKKMSSKLKPFWKCVFWFQHKLARPFIKLQESNRKRQLLMNYQSRIANKGVV